MTKIRQKLDMVCVLQVTLIYKQQHTGSKGVKNLPLHLTLAEVRRWTEGVIGNRVVPFVGNQSRHRKEAVSSFQAV